MEFLVVLGCIWLYFVNIPQILTFSPQTEYLISLKSSHELFL